MSIFKNCKDTLVVQTHRIFPSDLNQFGFLFGGKLVSLIDDTASISVSKFCRRGALTASVDTLNFLHPLLENHSVSIKTYVSGAHKKSMEVFVEVIGEDLSNGKRYLASTCFVTFVIIPSYMDSEGTDSMEVILPKIIPETDEEKNVCREYEKRRQVRIGSIKQQNMFISKLSI